MDDKKKEILKYEQDNENYRISVCFNNSDSLDSKMKVVKMIDEMNVNHKVAILTIGINDSDTLNEELIKMMIGKYKNVYKIEVNNWGHLINKKVHESINNWLNNQIY